MTMAPICNSAWIIAWDAGRRCHIHLTEIDVAFTGNEIVHVGRGYRGSAER